MELESKLQAKREEFETELHLKIEALNREITTVKHENKAKEVEIEALKDNIASEIAEKNILKEKVVELETDMKLDRKLEQMVEQEEVMESLVTMETELVTLL